MARSSGFKCDRPGCTVFSAEQEGTFPAGWYQVSIYSVGAQVPGKPARPTTVDICSADCLEKLGKLRKQAERDLNGDPKHEGKARGGALASHNRFHVGRDVLQPGCEFCEALTAPV